MIIKLSEPISLFSPLKKLDYLLTFQPDYGILGESTIILVDLKCANKTM